MKKTSLVVGILLLVVVAFAFLRFGGKNMQTKNPSQDAGQIAQNVASQNVVMIKNFAFTPQTLTIKAGQSVTWNNQDSAPHSIKADAFNSDVLKTGQSFTFTFKTPGTYSYICGIHPMMKGTIVVE